jgi:hypothetical protein
MAAGQGWWRGRGAPDKISDGRGGWRRRRSDAGAGGGGGRQGSWAVLSAPLLLPLLGRDPSQSHLRLRVAPAITATAGAPEPRGTPVRKGMVPPREYGLATLHI